MPVAVEDIAKQMLVLPPEDGTPVLNSVMQAMLARTFASDIATEHYLSARLLNGARP